MGASFYFRRCPYDCERMVRRVQLRNELVRFLFVFTLSSPAFATHSFVVWFSCERGAAWRRRVTDPHDLHSLSVIGAGSRLHPPLVARSSILYLVHFMIARLSMSTRWSALVWNASTPRSFLVRSPASWVCSPSSISRWRLAIPGVETLALLNCAMTRVEHRIPFLNGHVHIYV